MSKKLKGIYCYIEKKQYIIYMDGKIIKQSIYPYKLLDWFTKEYPTEILILNNIF